jgi:two-component system, sensor histidine kinase and response regulator
VAFLLQSDPNLAARLILTVNTRYDAEMVHRLKPLGLRHILIKPLKRRELKNAIDDILTRRYQAATVAGERIPANTPDDTAMKILLVDDSEDNCLLIKAFLKKTAHRLTLAANGHEGLQKFKAAPFDLVLMDMHMPLMDGYTATREIRRWEANHHQRRTPVIALTANAMREDEQASLEAGCDRHLTKPLTRQRLLETLATIPITATPEPSPDRMIR